MGKVKDRIAEVELALIDEPKDIVRMEIATELVAELAESINAIGLLQPILLRPDGERYEIIAGHRRFLAHKRLQVKTIKAIVREMTDTEASIARATENLARVDLTPIEEAFIFQGLRENHNMSFDQIGAKVGKSGGLVKRRMDLLRMPPQLRDAVHKRKISISVAEELWPISDIPTLDYYLSFALDGGCTSIVARSWCKDWKDTLRRKESDIGAGGQVFAPSEPRPVYVSCDLCTGPMEIGQEVVLRVCANCFKTINEHM
jgi:ParB family chromosome partitioning protein